MSPSFSRWFSTPDPDYSLLVRMLYGDQVGGALYRSYVEQLSRRDLWGHRLSWSGVAIYDRDGVIKAHAVVQVTSDSDAIYIGYVESVDDPLIAASLRQTLQEKLEREHPDTPVYMPVNLSIWHNYRFKVSGEGLLPFESPTKLYYSTLFSGWLPEVEHYTSYRLVLQPSMSVMYSRSEEAIDERNVFAQQRSSGPSSVIVRELSLNNIESDLRIIYDLSVRVFEDVHSVPSFAEFQAIYDKAIVSADPKYILIAEEAGEPVGFISSIIVGDELFVKTLAVLPAHQQRGIGRLLYSTLCARALEEGCRTLYGLMMRNDRLITQLLPPGAEKVSEYVLFRR